MISALDLNEVEKIQKIGARKRTETAISTR